MQRTVPQAGAPNGEDGRKSRSRTPPADQGGGPLLAVPQPARIGEVLLTTKTQPIGLGQSDLSRPGAEEVQSTAALLRAVVRPTLEPSQRDAARKEGLRQLQSLLAVWAQAICPTVSVARCRIYVYGSYRLSVHLPDGDLDVLAVAPPLVGEGGGEAARATRERFFLTFGEVLRKYLDPPPTALHVVPEAHVPVVKLDWREIEIDVGFACADCADPADVVSDEVLARCDDKSRNSISGVRNGEAVLAAVPNHAVFWGAARAIKRWAERRGVYGNLYGYLGGGAVAIMVARLCQHTPFRLSSSVARAFFRYYRSWFEEAAESLGAGAPPPEVISVTSGAAVWWRTQLKHQPGQPQAMIANPTAPFTNALRNATMQSLRAIQAEVGRADELLSQSGNDMRSESLWAEIVSPRDRFHGFTHFVEVEAAAQTERGLREWAGFVASRLRLLPDLITMYCGVHAELIPVEYHPPTGSGMAGDAIPGIGAGADPDGGAESDDDGVAWTWERDQGASKRPRLDAPPLTAVHYVALAGGSGAVSIDAALMQFEQKYLRSGPTPPPGASGPRVRVLGRAALPRWLTPQRRTTGSPRAAHGGEPRP